MIKFKPANDPAPILGQIPLLSELDPETLTAFIDDLDHVQCDQGQAIVEQDDLTDEVYFVLSGRLIGILLSPNGKEVAFTAITSGHYFGELSALDGRPRSLTISATEETHLARMDSKQFLFWMTREPTIARNLAIDLAERNRTLTNRVFGLVIHDVDKRVRALLTQQAQSSQQLKTGGILDPSPTHDVIANYIGATREAVSRVMARLASTGVIKTERRRMTFLDVDALLEGL